MSGVLKTVIPPLMVKEGGMESVQLGASLGREGLPAGELLGLLWNGRAWMLCGAASELREFSHLLSAPGQDFQDELQEGSVCWLCLH